MGKQEAFARTEVACAVMRLHRPKSGAWRHSIHESLLLIIVPVPGLVIEQLSSSIAEAFIQLRESSIEHRSVSVFASRFVIRHSTSVI